MVSGQNPKHEKNSARKAFSFVPTKPVAGEALKLTLRERMNQETKDMERFTGENVDRGKRTFVLLF